jgi:netrin-G3 ligand
MTHTAPGAPPQKFHGEPEDSTSIRVTWAPPPEDKQHGDIMYYKIFFVDNTLSDTESSQVTISDPNARDFIMDQLRKWTDYRIWILAGTSVGDGPITDSIIVRTDEDGTNI